ncbi:hypothetical protein [Oceanirhabdus sp. W0125-5]|uniref:hypothetical protein n=1 Tax=Oceanirhabdus sp. W0125-5 TaxID=2999116 RepID=UPI0022F3093F|nr:hypothetical protein [Oceanirhabdus sp. W0125-5]WBW98683.1 hypothetical protein OW730_07970 [Oceanirhabdus sp. W0125-5]
MSGNKILKKSNSIILYSTKLYLLKIFLVVAVVFLIWNTRLIYEHGLIVMFFSAIMMVKPIYGIRYIALIKELMCAAVSGIITAGIIQTFGVDIISCAVSLTIAILINIKINWREKLYGAFLVNIYIIANSITIMNSTIKPLTSYMYGIIGLIIGGFIGILFNSLFSTAFFSKLLNNSFKFLIGEMISIIKSMMNGLEYEQYHLFHINTKKFHRVFKDIEWIYSHYEENWNEDKYRQYSEAYERKKLNNCVHIIMFIREIGVGLFNINTSLMKIDKDKLEENIRNSIFKKLKEQREFLALLEDSLAELNTIPYKTSPVSFEKYNDKELSKIEHTLKFMDDILLS